MAERKVLNKYYPPDFDPSKLRRFEKKSVRKMCNVRMMLPMSVRCHTCGNYAYIGTKFNMKVETVKDEDYLGIKIYRFYFKCTQCYSEITFRTDPKNHDYIAEWGASRNHEPWKDMLMAEEEYKEMKQNEMKEDAMKSLEHRTYDSKREMDILDALDQVKSLNRRQANVNYEEMIEKVIHKEQEKEEKEMEQDIQNEVNKIYERMKVRRIRDYNDLGLNEDSCDFNRTNQKEKKGEISKFGIDENCKFQSLEGGKFTKNLNYESDDDMNNEYTNRDNINNNINNYENQDQLHNYSHIENESKSINKTNIEDNTDASEKDLNNKNRTENSEKSKLKSLLHKKRNFSDIIGKNQENISDDSDSIENDFNKNKEIFNFKGAKTKLKISKNVNKDIDKKINFDTNKKINGKIPKYTKNINLNDKSAPCPIGNPKYKINKNNSFESKPKASGLYSLLSNYTTD